MTNLNKVLSIIDKAIKESARPETGYAPLPSVAHRAYEDGYEREQFGKPLYLIKQNPERYETMWLDKTQCFVKLKESIKKALEMPESFDGPVNHTDKTYTPGYNDAIMAEILGEISDTQFFYISPLLGDKQLKINKDLTASLIKYAYARLIYEKKVLVKGTDRFFNTGLLDTNFDYIYAIAEVKMPGKVRIKKCMGSESPCARKTIEEYNAVPEPPCFSSDPLKAFNSKCNISLNIDHLLVDRFYRLPKSFKQLLGIECNYENCESKTSEIRKLLPFIRRVFLGALEETKKRINKNPFIPVKYWYKESNRLCWLIPLDLGVKEEEPVALVVEEVYNANKPEYVAPTLLDLNSAYKGARLVEPVNSEWLKWTSSQD